MADSVLHLNSLVITTCDNTQLLVRMSKGNIIDATNMSIDLKHKKRYSVT